MNYTKRRQGSTDSSCSSESEASNQCFRIVVLGAAAVGKTCVISQFLGDGFRPKYRATVEDIHRHEYVINDCDVTLEILDTSGSYEFPAMRRLAMATGDAFILVFALDNAESLSKIADIYSEIAEIRGESSSNGELPPVIIVGNKSDCDERCFSTQDTLETMFNTVLDAQWGYIECSAKLNDNIETIFFEVVERSRLVNSSTQPTCMTRVVHDYTHKSSSRRKSKRASISFGDIKTPKGERPRSQSCVVS